MRKIVLAGAVLAGLTPAAYAADMPAPPVETVAPEPVFSWTGAYIGAHGGWNWSEVGSDFFDPADDFDIDIGDGFVIGGQVGYNWQWNYWLLGLEGDASFVDNSDDNFFVGAEQNFLASIRGRLGFAVDRFLVYGTGGAAWAGFDVDFADPVFNDDEITTFGWVAGGGIEYAFTDNVTFGVEFLHYEFDDESFDDAVGDDFLDIGLSNDVIRGRLNIKFGSLFN